MKFFVFVFLIFYIFQIAHGKEDGHANLVSKINIMRNEAEASINNLKIIKKDYLTDLKYQLSCIKTETLQEINVSIKQILYRIKSAEKTGNVIDCYQSHRSDVHNSNFPAKKILDECWSKNTENIYSPINVINKIEPKLIVRKSDVDKKCYEEAESSIERLLLVIDLDLTKCSYNSLQSALNLTAEADRLINSAGNIVIDRLNSMQKECELLPNDEEIDSCILRRIRDVSPYAKQLKELTEYVLDQRKPTEFEAVINIRSCGKRPVADMYNIMFIIERTANACFRSL